MGQLFESFVGGAGILVLLDGLDEVASDDYPRTAMAIRGLSAMLAEQSDRNIVVLTMREQFHQQVRRDFAAHFPTVYRIAPFSPADIFTFLERWPFDEAGFEHVSRIYADLTDRPTLREMCRNPLVLAMYVANDQRIDGQASPDTRTSFYDQVVGELLVERRSRQLGMSARSVLREKREEILGRLALGNLTDRAQAANSLSWSAALGVVEDVYKCSRSDAEQKLLDLERDTGIISQERDLESFRFIHLTFGEFLAGKEIAQGRNNGITELLHRHDDFQAAEQPQLRARLNEVIPFAVALLPRAQKPTALAKVADACGQEILGRCLLETQIYGGEVWKSYLEREQERLVQTSPADWTAEWLAGLHLFNVVLQDAERWAQISGERIDASLADLFEGLVGSDRDRLIKLFSSYAQTDAAAALRLAEACGVDLAIEQPQLVLHSCEFPPFIAVALQRADPRTESGQRWLQLLAEAGLRRDVSAFVLSRHEAPEVLESAVARLPPGSRWAPLPRFPIVVGESGAMRSSPPGERLSAYSAVLTLAIRCGKVDPKFRALAVLSRVRPPGGVLPARLVAVATIAVAVGVGYLLWKMVDPHGVGPFFLSAVLILLAVQPLAVYPARRSQRYAVLVNLAVPYSLWSRWILSGADEVSYLRSRILMALMEVESRIYLPRLSQACREMVNCRHARGPSRRRGTNEISR